MVVGNDTLHVRLLEYSLLSEAHSWDLFRLSQLIGSTLALRYLRAEYVAPLGATSLIFNFLFASLLVGTPVTNTDIYVRINWSLIIRSHSFDDSFDLLQCRARSLLFLV